MEDIEMIDLSYLTKQDVKTLENKIGFTNDEICILEHLVRDDLNDDGLMIFLGMSRNKYYKVKMNMLNKIIRCACQ